LRRPGRAATLLVTGGTWMRPTSRSPVSGPVSTGRPASMGRSSMSCCRQGETWRPPVASSPELCGPARSRPRSRPTAAGARPQAPSVRTDPGRRSRLHAEPAPRPLRHRHRRPRPPAAAPHRLRRPRHHHLINELSGIMLRAAEDGITQQCPPPAGPANASRGHPAAESRSHVQERYQL
jgi:hypothetical protein